MSTLDKLRSLHQEVCLAWRRYNEPAISEGEADILNIGFALLERLAEWSGNPALDGHVGIEFLRARVSRYTSRVHSQFDSDADIKITGV